MVRLPPNYNPEDDPNRHLRLGDFPAAWRNRNHDPWTEPPDPRPWPLPTDGTIWNPHPQYILDWDQPVAFEQQPVNVLPTYQCRPVTGESTLARTCRRLRRADPVPFPTPCQALHLPPTSNDDPSQNSDIDTLVDCDVPEQIQIRPNVLSNIDPDEDQRTPWELLLLETRQPGLLDFCLKCVS